MRRQSSSRRCLIASEFPESNVVGYDVSDEALELARGRAREITNLTFENHPAEAIPTDPPFELITSFDVIHDLADPRRTDPDPGSTGSRRSVPDDGAQRQHISGEQPRRLECSLLWGLRSALHDPVPGRWAERVWVRSGAGRKPRSMPNEPGTRDSSPWTTSPTVSRPSTCSVGDRIARNGGHRTS